MWKNAHGLQRPRPGARVGAPRIIIIIRRRRRRIIIVIIVIIKVVIVVIIVIVIGKISHPRNHTGISGSGLGFKKWCWAKWKWIGQKESGLGKNIG